MLPSRLESNTLINLRVGCAPRTECPRDRRCLSSLLVLAILLVNEVLDVKWDGLAGKRTLVVRLGERRGYHLFLICYVAAYAWILAGTVAGIYRPLAALGLAPALVSAKGLLPSRALANRAGTIGASARTVISHTATGIVIAASYLVS